MKNTFYIIEKDHWFQLIVLPSHSCVSCSSSLSVIFNTIEEYTKKYKTPEALNKRIENMEYGSKVPHKVLEERLLMYPIYKELYIEKIENAVAKGIHYNCTHGVYNKLIKKKIVIPDRAFREIESVKEEIAVNKPVLPKLLRFAFNH